MQEYLTIFRAKNNKDNSKVPYSIYSDNTYVFESYLYTKNLDMYNTMVSHFILNIPLVKLEKATRTFRRKAHLEKFHNDAMTYIILDIDDVHTPESQKAILEYFKDYKCILGQSKSFNGINNFRMKGILFTEDISFDDAKLAVSGIHHDLKKFCTFDESVVRKVSLNAPISKNHVFLNNETGKRYKFVKTETVDHIEKIRKEYIGESHNINISDLEGLEADTIDKLCLKVFHSMGFEAIKNNANNSISFKHPNEKKSPGGYFWFNSSPYTMHHFNSTKTVNIFDTVRNLPAAKELLKQEINYDDEFLQFNTDTCVVSVNERYLKITDEIENSVRQFLGNPDGLFSIRSPMGTGKSTIINYLIEEAHEEDMNVLIITNRISVAQDFGKKYNLKVYNKDKYNPGDSLVCQYDSLWKYNLHGFDVVIMDEFISLMTHTRSNLNNSAFNIDKFFKAFNKKLVIADAFLTGYENFLLDNKKTNIHMIDNQWRDPTTLYSYDNMNYFVQSILVHSEKHKITVSATSMNFIHSLEMLLRKRGLKVVTLTAQTPDTTKNLIYDLFEENEHDKWDVLIFSPTLTVGVSNLNDVPYHFHYDTSMSADAVSSIQMLKRTRKTKEIHMFVKARINYIKTSYNDIRDEYMGNIGRNADQNYLFKVDKYGETRLSNIGKKAIKIDTFKNILEFNHKEAIMWLLKYHFMSEPRIIDNKFQGSVLHKYQKIVREDNKEVLMNQVHQFLELNNMEKTSLLMDSDADKTMKILAEIEDTIKIECPDKIKTTILECVLNDRLFIQKALFYKCAFNYTKKIWDETDVKNLVSQSVIKGRKHDLSFYNSLISYGQVEIFDEYLPKHINANKHLKHILNSCGYKITKQSEPGIVGHRGYVVNKNVKELYGWFL